MQGEELTFLKKGFGDMLQMGNSRKISLLKKLGLGPLIKT